jgi:hypothetical protein
VYRKQADGTFMKTGSSTSYLSDEAVFITGPGEYKAEVKVYHGPIPTSIHLYLWAWTAAELQL